MPTNQVLLAELNIAHGHMIHHVLLAAVVWSPVVDVVLAPVLLVDRPVIVAVHHPVDPQHICLILLHDSLRLEYNCVASWDTDGVIVRSGED